MEEIIKLIQDFGIYGCLMIVILFLGFKYLPQYIELKLSRMKEKDYMIDSFKSVVDNNTQVIQNNSKVIELNSNTIKKFTANSHNLENKIDGLAKEVHETNKILNDESVDLKIIKEKID